MTCLNCNEEKAAAEMEPGTLEINFQICTECVDQRVAEKAKETAEAMVISTTHRTSDETPQQLKADERCCWCRDERRHSNWAHEDALEEYHQAADIEEMVDRYNGELLGGEEIMTGPEMAGIMIG